MKKLWIISISLLLGVCSASFADELILTNGDVISGEIISLNTTRVVINSPTLGRLSIERSKVKKGVFYGTQPPISSPPFEAPTDAVIMTDWKDAVRDNLCRNFVKFTRVKIVQKRLLKDGVEVQLEVTGDWFGKQEQFSGGPCRGFLFVRGKDQVVDKKMIYKKWGNRWRLESLN